MRFGFFIVLDMTGPQRKDDPEKIEQRFRAMLDKTIKEIYEDMDVENCQFSIFSDIPVKNLFQNGEKINERL